MSGRKLASFSVNAFNNSSFYPVSSFLGFQRPLRSFSSSTDKAGGSSNFGSSSGSSSSSSSSSNRRSSGKKRSWGRKAIHIGLISVAGGFALSAVNDVAIFHGCSSKAIEKASQNSKIVESIGVPIVRGPWYDASLAVGHRRNSVSCTFPVSGPQGSAIFQLKAIRNGEDGLFSFLRHHDWDILIMEALLHVPSNDEKQQTLRISLTADSPTSTALVSCDGCTPQEFESQGK